MDKIPITKGGFAKLKQELKVLKTVSIPQNIKDIARQLFTSSSAATQLVNELVAKGLLMRKADKVDRRKVELVLTAAGSTCLKQAKKDHIKMTEKMLKGLDDRELVQFLTLHRKLAQHLRAK